MLPRRSDFRLGLCLATTLAALFVSGCATVSVKYSYDAKAAFPELKTYKWVDAVVQPGHGPQDLLLETNVARIADQDLGSKGFTKGTDAADLIVWVGYDVEFDKHFQLRSLTLTVARADNKNIIWQGTAAGPIHTDAASKSLDDVVTRMLASFPPK